MKGKKRIDRMFAFVTMDDDGTEGVLAFLGPGGTWMPMVGADMERVNTLRPIAKDMAHRTGKVVSLVEFSTRTPMEQYDPQERRQPSAGNPNAN